MKSFKLSPQIVLADTCEEYFSSVDVMSSDLLITSKHIYDDYLSPFFKNAHVIFIRNYGSGEPTDKMADAISEDLAGIAYTRVFAVGGGTVLDIAKLYAQKCCYPVAGLFTGEIPFEKNKELILIPTTCGTGSEITNISIMELTQLTTKKGLANDNLFGDCAVLIPELLETLPYDAFIASVADALIHAMESYMSPKATVFSQMFSVRAIGDIVAGFKYISANGRGSQAKIIDKFLIAAATAGIAFSNAGCAAVHALSYPLGAVCHVPHGKSNYTMLNAVMKKYEEKQVKGAFTQLKAILAESLDCSSENAFDELDKLMGELIGQKPLSLYGLTKDDLVDFAKSVVENQQRLLVNSPIEITLDDITDIYFNLY